MTFRALARATAALRHPAELLAKLVVAWLRWFWRLGATAKVVCTAAEILALNLLVGRLPTSAVGRAEVLDGGSVGLCLVLVFALLFSSVRTR